MARAIALVIGVGCLVNNDGGMIIENAVPTTDDGSLMGRDISSAIGASGPVTGDTALAAVSGSSTTDFDGLVNWLPTPTTSMVESLILMVCLKSFTCHTKHFKIFYWKCFITFENILL